MLSCLPPSLLCRAAYAGLLTAEPSTVGLFMLSCLLPSRFTVGPFPGRKLFGGIQYSFNQPEIAGLKEVDAGKYVSFYWGGAMIGRFVGAYLTTKIKPNLYLMANALIAAVLVLVSMFTFGQVAMWSILAVGLFNSIMFPTIFTLAIDGLGKHTGQASGILCTAIVGGALIPVLQGYFADTIGIQLAFFIPVLCYLYIAYYGFKGYKPALR